MCVRRVLTLLNTACCIVALGGFANTVSYGASWSYVNPANAGNQILLDETAQTAAIGDLANTAAFCGDHEAMKCFKSGSLSFAVPRGLDFSKAESSWEHGGVKFTGKRRSAPLAVLGQKLEVYSIETVNTKVGTRFLFSPTHGLVAIMTSEKAGGPLLLLQEACGFGAGSQCR